LFAPGALTSQGTRREPRAQIATVGHTHIFGTSIANDARIGFTRLRLNILNKNAFTQNIPQQLGINGEDGLPSSAWDVPMVSFTEGLTSFGGATFGVPSVTRDNTYQFQDTLSFTRGSHNLRMGLQFTRYQLNNATLNYILPQYIYRATPLTADVTNPVGNSRGSEFADFMLGYFHSIQVSSGSGQIYLRRNVMAPWAEDIWRATRNLTVTLGVRWDYFSPYVEQDNHIGSLYVPQPNGPGFPIPVLAGMNIAGYGNVPRGLFPKDLNNWAPRVGLAYRPRGSEKTVFRLGYGIFYDAQIGNTLVDMVRNPPFQVRIIADMPDSIFPSFVLRDPFPQGFGVTSSYFAYGQEKGGRLDSPTPYVQQWNATVQRELVPNWAATIAYVGSTGRHLSLSSVDNVPYPGPGPLNSRRPFNPFLTSIFQWAQPRVNSYYHALQVKSEQRGFHGLTLLNSYTWSKSIDTGTEVRAGGTAQQSLNDWNQDEENRGRSTFDVRHRYVASLLYEIPVGPGKPFLNQRSLAGHALGGWQINAISTVSSGLPFTIYSGVDTANSGVASLVHPDAIIGADPKPPQQTADRWFNPGAFATAPDCRNQAVFNTLTNPLACFGNLGRNTFSAPGLLNLDFSLMKNMQIGDLGKVQFRTEFFNIFNTPPFGFPSATLTSVNAGRILSAGAARQIQFSLRYAF